MPSSFCRVKPIKLHTPTHSDFPIRRQRQRHESLRDVPIDWETLRANCQNKGSYLLLLENQNDITLSVGKLGEIRFERGYIYVGSAMNSLDTRLKRHQCKQKTRFWHIDYLASTAMPVRKGCIRFAARRSRSRHGRCAGTYLRQQHPGFGASDSAARSHLFYFRSSPTANRQFVELLFTFRTL